VTIVATARRIIYVSNDGNDQSNGQSNQTAIRTLARAEALLKLAGNNVEVLFKRGDVFTQNQTFDIGTDNIVISAYGQGTDPIIRWTGPRNGNAMFYIAPTSDGATIRGLAIQSIYTDTKLDGLPLAVSVAGSHATIADNDFRNLDTAINSNAEPEGLFVVDNRSPSDTGLKSYFLWAQGSDLVVVGNTVKNSIREAIIRIWNVTRANVSYNSLTNLDRRSIDPSDFDKNTITNQKGDYSYVAYNTLRGPVGIGPLGGPDGLHGINSTSDRLTHTAWEGNDLNSRLMIWHGSENVTIRDNVMRLDDGQIIGIESFDNQYGRGVRDVVIDSNTASNQGTTGRFLMVGQRINGITLTNNIYSAPRLIIGQWQSAALWVNDTGLQSFSRISGNVWPSTANNVWWANGGVNYVGLGTYDRQGHVPTGAWNSLSQVGSDEFSDVRITAGQTGATVNGRNVGSRLSQFAGAQQMTEAA